MAWTPLESNPEIMNKYLHKLGVPEKWNMVDVYGLDSESLAWVSRPVLSVILLFPCTDQYYEYRDKQAAEIKASGQSISPDVFYMKQVVPNACGTVALIHSVANSNDAIQLGDGHLKQFLDDCKTMSPDDRGDFLQKADNIINAHKEIAQEGQTEAPDPDCPVNHHFVAFVHVDGNLYELDGRKEFPINHGPTTQDNLIEDAAKVCKDYIARQPDDVAFTVVALTNAD
ncbi:Ubiquitin carboxy-terminal hydrolase [Carabus blaptoides fortunei]